MAKSRVGFSETAMKLYNNTEKIVIRGIRATSPVENIAKENLTNKEGIAKDIIGTGRSGLMNSTRNIKEGVEESLSGGRRNLAYQNFTGVTSLGLTLANGAAMSAHNSEVIKTIQNPNFVDNKNIEEAFNVLKDSNIFGQDKEFSFTGTKDFNELKKGINQYGLKNSPYGRKLFSMDKNELTSIINNPTADAHLKTLVQATIQLKPLTTVQKNVLFNDLKNGTSNSLVNINQLSDTYNALKKTRIITDDAPDFRLRNFNDLKELKKNINVYARKNIDLGQILGERYRYADITNLKANQLDRVLEKLGPDNTRFLNESKQILETVKSINKLPDSGLNLYKSHAMKFKLRRLANTNLGSFEVMQGMNSLQRYKVAFKMMAKVQYAAYKYPIMLAGKGAMALTRKIGGTYDFLPDGTKVFKWKDSKLGRASSKINTGISKTGKVLSTPEKLMAKSKVQIKDGKQLLKTKVSNSKMLKPLNKAKRTLVRPFQKPLNFVRNIRDKALQSLAKLLAPIKAILIKIAIPVGIALAAVAAIAAVIMIMGSVLSVFFGDESAKENGKDPYQVFQDKYDECDTQFLAEIDTLINGYATTLNKKGEQIKYGVNGASNPETNVNGDYKEGVTLTYATGVSSNIEDILSCLAIIMNQEQGLHMDEALALEEALYKSSHFYQYFESALYQCQSGCTTTHYRCWEDKLNYSESDLKFEPWKYSDVVTPTGECVVCKSNGVEYKDYAGCTVTGTCYHGENGDMGRSHNGCTNYEAVWDCDHSCDSEDCSHDCSGRALGCAGHYECLGHDHYGCPDGHDIATCFGHVDLTVNINIADMETLMTFGGVEVNEDAENSGMDSLDESKVEENLDNLESKEAEVGEGVS